MSAHLQVGVPASIEAIELLDCSESNGPAYCTGIVTTAVQIAADIIERDHGAQ